MKDSNNRNKNLEWFKQLDLSEQLDIFQDIAAMSRIIANNLMQEDVTNMCGEKYSREKPHDGQYSRWGYNPGSIKIGDEKLPIEIPRVFDNISQKALNSPIYQELKEQETPSEKMIKSILLGLSQKDYGQLSKTIAESFGLSQSTISRKFIEESSKELESYEQRDLGKYDFTALLIDGKYLSKEQIIIALGITTGGDKLVLGFVESTTENSRAVKGLLRNLLERNFRYQEGLLCVLDGAKGLTKAVKETFGEYCVIQRCQWHKRENVVSYLGQSDAEYYRQRLQSAYREPSYEMAKSRLTEIINELSKNNRSAANSLREGLEQTLTIHRLGLAVEFGRALTTTNSIENVNSKIAQYLRKIKHWKTPDMLARWIAMALIETETRLRRIPNYKKLHLLRKAIKAELKLNQSKVA